MVRRPSRLSGGAPAPQTRPLPLDGLPRRRSDARPPAHEAAGKDASERERLGKRERELRRRADALAARERELREREAALDAREQELRRLEAALAAQEDRPLIGERWDPALFADVGPPEVRTVALVPANGRARRWNVEKLTELAEGATAEHPDCAEEWSTYLFWLRSFADDDGLLPPSFSGLVEDVFAPALTFSPPERARRSRRASE